MFRAGLTSVLQRGFAGPAATRATLPRRGLEEFKDQITPIGEIPIAGALCMTQQFMFLQTLMLVASSRIRSCIRARAYRKILDCGGAATEVVLRLAQAVVGAVQGEEYAANRKACSK
jgi:hypothetical protein